MGSQQRQPNGETNDWLYKLAAPAAGPISPDIFTNGNFIRRVKHDTPLSAFLVEVVRELKLVEVEVLPGVEEYLLAPQAEYNDLQTNRGPTGETEIGLTGARLPEGSTVDAAFMALQEALINQWNILHPAHFGEAYRFARFVVADALYDDDLPGASWLRQYVGNGIWRF